MFSKRVRQAGIVVLAIGLVSSSTALMHARTEASASLAGKAASAPNSAWKAVSVPSSAWKAARNWSTRHHDATISTNPDGGAFMGTRKVGLQEALSFNRPAFLLSGDPLGLKLQGITYLATPDAAAVQYVYQNSDGTYFFVVL